MTDRHAGYLVVLGGDVREDDAEAIITALSMVRGVIAVQPVVGTPELHISERRAKSALPRKLREAIED